MRRAAWVLGVAFFFLNPGFACGPAEPKYEYGADEMRAAVEGNWSFTIMPEGAAAPAQVTVTVTQAEAAPHARARGRSLVRAAYACGSRTLVKSAQACIDTSVMPLTVTFVSGDPSFSSAALSGTFEVFGTEFGPFNNNLQLTLGDFAVLAEVGPDGSVLNARVGQPGSAGTLTILTRS